MNSHEGVVCELKELESLEKLVELYDELYEINKSNFFEGLIIDEKCDKCKNTILQVYDKWLE